MAVKSKLTKNNEEGANAMSTEKKTKRITIAGNAMILTSKLKLETIQKMEKYNPKALCLIEVDKNDEETEVFRIASGKLSSISKYGITFAEANSKGNAIATVLFPEGINDKKQYIKDNFANVMFMLEDLEDAVETACTALEMAYAKLDDEIEVQEV